MSCCGFNNGCNCGSCSGVRMSQFAELNRVAANTYLVTDDNNKVSVQSVGNYLMLGNVTVSWGMIDGTLSNQADLQDALNLKAPLDGATMINSTYNGVDLESTGLPTEFLAADGSYYTGTASVSWGGITGTLSDQADLQAALDDKEDITPFVLKSADFTVTDDHASLDVDASGGDVTIELPALSAHGHYIIRRINSTGGNVIIDANTVGGTTINGANTFTITGSSTPNAISIWACTSEYGIV